MPDYELIQAVIEAKGAYVYTGQTPTTCDAFRAAALGGGDQYCTHEQEHDGPHSWE